MSGIHLGRIDNAAVAKIGPLNCISNVNLFIFEIAHHLVNFFEQRADVKRTIDDQISDTHREERNDLCNRLRERSSLKIFIAMPH